MDDGSEDLSDLGDLAERGGVSPTRAGNGDESGREGCPFLASVARDYQSGVIDFCVHRDGVHSKVYGCLDHSINRRRPEPSNEVYQYLEFLYFDLAGDPCSGTLSESRGHHAAGSAGLGPSQSEGIGGHGGD